MTVQEEAVAALRGMETIVRNEMLIRGVYVTPEVVDVELAESGAICGGHQACAIGSLWLGGGVAIEQDDVGDAYLPGIEDWEREEFLADKPGLRLAYDTMNKVSAEYIAEHGLSEYVRHLLFDSETEKLFEARVPRHNWEEPRRPLINADEVFPLLIRRAWKRIEASS